MKHRVLFSVSILMLLAIFCLPIIAQPSAKAVETFVIDDFDSPDGKAWTWNVNSSRFIAEGFPKTAYVPGIPNSLKPFRDADDPEAKVLGVQVAFDRKGDNWFEVYPVDSSSEDGKNYEIPFRGIVSQIDFWVWGANYNYTLEVLIRDADGRVVVLPACVTNFNGWRNIVVNIPSSITQHSRLRSGPKSLSFVGFRVRSNPAEYVDDFAIFFDQLKYTTNTLNNIYDGYDLGSIDFDNVDSASDSGSAE